MTLPATLGGFEREAAQTLSPPALAYYAGGAGDERTLRDNVAAWGRWALRPRVGVDVSRVDPSVELLGRRRAHPLLVAPMAAHALATAEAEEATVRAAAATHTPFVLSTLGTRDNDQVAAAAPDATRWFQLYLFRDRGITRDLVASARDAGAEALVVTLDLPVMGRREREFESGHAPVGDAQAVPSARATGKEGRITIQDLIKLIDPSVTWTDLEGLVAEAGLPVVVKGVLTPEDAEAARDIGAAAVIVSNHGGRQLDGVLSGADALGPVAERVGGEVELLVDGGIRRGADVVRALALGARAVLIGRPVLWGLAVAGEAGARAVLQLLLDELDNALALTGVPRAEDVARAHVQPAPWAAGRPAGT